MAINSTISTNTILGTSTCQIYEDTTLIETLVYNFSDNSVAFLARTGTSISGTDFLLKLNIYTLFNNTIIRTFFNLSQFQYHPFYYGSFANGLVVSLSDNGTNTMSYTASFVPPLHPTPQPIFLQFVSTYPSGTTTLNARTSDVTISYPQWLYLINSIASYIPFVYNDYKL